MRRRTLFGTTLAALAMPALLCRAAESPREEGEVDVLLLLAVDVSRSMDEEEARLQRAGYLSALRSFPVLDAIQGGALGAIGLAYLEWSGIEHQRLLVPWTRIGSAAQAEGFCGRLEAEPIGVGTWTSISGALDAAGQLMAEAPFPAMRQVIDISGDGMNNSGPPVEGARERVLAQGITVNGLPVLTSPSIGSFSGAGAMPLDEYYREKVMGGIGAFVLPAEDFGSFGRAVRRKLMLEIAGRMPDTARA